MITQKKFYVVATPIGNLEDITLRALRVLKEADVILCEDTRVTKKLLTHYEITAPTESYHSQSSQSKTEKILAMMEEGTIFALVSDSGTPTISDPGSYLVAQIRERFGDDVEVIAIPGANAAIAALSISGFPASEFLFLGFLPHKKGRETIFKEIAQCERTAVFYESPHRLTKALDSLVTHCGEERIIAVAKELTKIYEEEVVGTAGEVRTYFETHPDKVRGEFVVLVRGL